MRGGLFWNACQEHRYKGCTYFRCSLTFFPLFLWGGSNLKLKSKVWNAFAPLFSPPGRASTFHYLSVKERWTGNELREALAGLHLTIAWVEVTAPTLHPPRPQNHPCPLQLGPSPVSPPQREAALCRVVSVPTPLTTHRETPARVQAPAQPAPTRLLHLAAHHPVQLPLQLSRPQPARPLHTDTLFLIPTHSRTRCPTLADQLMEVSVLTFLRIDFTAVASMPVAKADVSVLSVAARTSPKAQRPPQSSRTSRTQNSHAQSTGTVTFWSPPMLIMKFNQTNFTFNFLTATRSPKSGSSQDTPYLDTSSVSLPAQKTSGPAPLFPVDGTVSPNVCVHRTILKRKLKHEALNSMHQLGIRNSATNWIIVPFSQWMRSSVQLQRNAPARARAQQRKARRVKVFKFGAG